MSTFLSPPPPFLPTVIGVNTQILPQPSTAADLPQHRSTPSVSSTSSAIIIVIIVIASAIIVTASLYLLIRCLSRRFHRSLRTFSADDVVSSRNNNNNNNNGDHILCFDHNSSSAPSQLLNSLPLFTFGSLTGNVAGGDCAVCLSKFEREDRLRLLPLCCHAFHAECIDAWLVSNQTCPLCRSSVHPTEAEVMSKIQSVCDDQRVNRNGNRDSNRNAIGSSFRIEIGSVSRRGGQFNSGRRSYSIGSFEYIVDDGYEVSVGSMHQRGSVECMYADKESIPDPPGESVAADVAVGGGGGGGRTSWLRDYVRTLSARTISFRGSGRFFTGSIRRNEPVLPLDDLEANRIGEEISELFRWFSGV